MAAAHGPRRRAAPRGHRTVSRDARPDSARVTVAPTARAGPAAAPDRSSSPTAGRPARSLPALRDQVDGGARRRPAHAAGTACSPSSAPTSTTSGSGADVEVEGDAELQQAVRFALFHVLQAGGARRGPGHPGQGADRHRATTATRSGTPRRFVLPVLTYTAPDAARDALRWRHSTLDLARDARAPARPRGRRLPVAHHPRRGVLGLLAGRHRGVPRQRRHRRRGDPLRRRHRRRRRSSATSASSCSSRPRGCGARSGTTTSTAASASTASPGPTSTAPSPTTTSTRTSWRSGTCAAPPTLRARQARAGRGARRHGRGDGRLAGRPPTRCHPVRREASACTSSREGFTRHEPVELRGARGPTSTRCCFTSPTSTSTASRWSSRPTWCWPCTCAATPSRPSRRRATSTTTSASPCATRRCRRAPRR